MRIMISGIPIDIQKKNIKNMHLQIKPPDGHVVISAPSSMDDKAIEVYARTNLSWIKKQIEKYQQQPRNAKRQYVSGETMYIWGKQFFMRFEPDNQKNGFRIQGDQVVISMNRDSTVKQREAFVREQYRSMLKSEIERLLPKWEAITGLHCEEWQTKYMITKWGACNTDKRRLWFNVQLAQKPVECLEYVILHELIHLRERTHNAAFLAYMDLYMPNWRIVRKDLNDRKLDYYDAQDENPLKKLIDTDRYNQIKDVVLEYCACTTKSEEISQADVTIENVVRIEQMEEGILEFDVITSCDIPQCDRNGKNDFLEKWVCVRCSVSIGIELTDFKLMGVSYCAAQEESQNDKFTGELVPVINKNEFEMEAERFLAKFCHEALERPMAIPIRQIAEEAMGLNIIEYPGLNTQFSAFGMVVFDDGNLKDKNRKIAIRNAKRGSVYIDPCVYYDATYGNINNTLAHECYHWYRHQPYHALMKMIDSKDDIGNSIKCSLQAKGEDSDKWKAVDWMEWQANGIAPKILMPKKTFSICAEELLKSVQNTTNREELADSLNSIIIQLSEKFGVTKQAVKYRLIELGYQIVDGVCVYSENIAVEPYFFDNKKIGTKETFTITNNDLLKAYTFSKYFREIIKKGAFVYIDKHLCLNSPEFIGKSEDGTIFMTEYALSHMDECCLTFELGFSYESKYQGLKNYNLMMFKMEQSGATEYTYENTAHNIALAKAMDKALTSTPLIRKLPASFSESLKILMKEKGINEAELSRYSLVGEKTIQRLRNNDDYASTKQVILALCVGLRLHPIEARALFGKSQHKLSETSPRDQVYLCIIETGPHNDIYDINAMLRCRNIPILGNITEDTVA